MKNSPVSSSAVVLNDYSGRPSEACEAEVVGHNVATTPALDVEACPDACRGNDGLPKSSLAQTHVPRGVTEPRPVSATAPGGLGPTPDQVDEMMVALRYFMADPAADSAALAAEVQRHLGRLDMAALHALGVEFSAAAAAFSPDDDREVFTLADAVAWAKSEAGQAYRQALLEAGTDPQRIPPLPARLGPAKMPAGEMAFIGAHSYERRLNGVDRNDSLVIRHDGLYEITRTGDAGREPIERGRARIEGVALLLEANDGTTRTFARQADDAGYSVWQAKTAAGVDTVRIPRHMESLAALAKRLVSTEGLNNYIYHGNGGIVDADPPIWRSRLPSPSRLERWSGLRKVKTVLSLNGGIRDVNVKMLGESDRAGDPQLLEINLGRFMSEHGIENVGVSLSSTEAPTDAELVSIFKVLLDDRKKPILLHCRQGADRTGIIAALYQVEFLGWTKEEAKAEMRRHLWGANGGTEIQGAYLDLYERGRIGRLLSEAGVSIPSRYAR